MSEVLLQNDISKIVYVGNTTQIVTNQRLWNAGIDESIFLVSLEDVRVVVDIECASFDPARYDSLLTETTIKYLIKKGNGLILVHKLNGVLTGYAQISFKKNLSSARFFSLDRRGSKKK